MTTSFNSHRFIVLLSQTVLLFCVVACQNETKSLSDPTVKSHRITVNSPSDDNTTDVEAQVEQTKNKAPVAIENAHSSFTFVTQSSQANSITVELHYHLRSTQQAPRSMELFLEYPEHLQLTHYQVLSELKRADKNLMIQSKEPGVSRVIAYGINTNELQSGPLLQMTLQGARQSNDLIHIREQFPLFAPVQANEGIVFTSPHRLSAR